MQKERNIFMDQEMFKDVVVFSMSEPGAMGPNDMTFYKKNGKSFSVDYKDEKTSYTKIKEWFPALNGCYWNGPMSTEAASVTTIKIGGSGRETAITSGWAHIYLGFGNHLVVKREFYQEMRTLFQEYDNCDITFGWPEILDKNKFSERIPEIEKAFYRQEGALFEYLCNE